MLAIRSASIVLAARVRVRAEGRRISPPWTRPWASHCSGERPEVLDVVRDHGPVLAAGDLEDDHVAAPGQVWAVGDRFHVEADLAKEHGDLRR